MKKLIFIGAIVFISSVASQAQIVRVAIRPAIVVRPACPAAGHVWVDGAWRWDRRLKQNVWVEGYWVVRPRFHPYHGRMRRF